MKSDDQERGQLWSITHVVVEKFNLRLTGFLEVLLKPCLLTRCHILVAASEYTRHLIPIARVNQSQC